MKKKFLLVGLCLTMAATMALAACGNPNKGKTIALSSPNDVYGMGAVSNVRLLGSNMPASAVKSFSAVNAAAKTRTCGVKLASAVADTSEIEVKEQSEKFNEYFTALRGFGYKAETTKLSGDQGIDVVAKKGNQILAIQAKHYNQAVGNRAIMEVVGGAKFYNATICYVVTNNYFTKSAKELAAANNVILWDRDKLIEKLSEI